MKHSKFVNTCGFELDSNTSLEREKQYGKDVLDTVQSGAMDIFDVVKSTGRFVGEEGKEIIQEVRKQGVRFDEKERLIKSIPNSYLVFGGIAILLYGLIK